MRCQTKSFNFSKDLSSQTDEFEYTKLLLLRLLCTSSLFTTFFNEKLLICKRQILFFFYTYIQCVYCVLYDMVYANIKWNGK